MRADVVAYLRCPVCRGPLRPADRCLRCAAGHSFDLARQGYVDLTGGPVTHAGDTAEMVAARGRLLTAGLFEPLRAAIVAASTGRPTPDEAPPAGEPGPTAGTAGTAGTAEQADTAQAAQPAGLVVDVGAGTGYYLAAVLDARPGDRGVAVDVSKAALRQAATAHPRAGAVRADIWRGLPLAAGVAGVVLDVFAPRSGPQFRRVLRPDGRLIVATPTPEHLGELVRLAGLLGVDPAKQRRLADTLGPDFHLVGERLVRWRVLVSVEQACGLVAMGPSAWHDGPARIAGALAGRDTPVPVTAAVRLTVWQPGPGTAGHPG